jgi:hypothetical protein
MPAAHRFFFVMYSAFSVKEQNAHHMEGARLFPSLEATKPRRRVHWRAVSGAAHAECHC